MAREVVLTAEGFEKLQVLKKILPAHAQRVQLKLIESKASANGTVSLKYLVQR